MYWKSPNIGRILRQYYSLKVSAFFVHCELQDHWRYVLACKLNSETWLLPDSVSVYFFPLSSLLWNIPILIVLVRAWLISGQYINYATKLMRLMTSQIIVRYFYSPHSSCYLVVRCIHVNNKWCNRPLLKKSGQVDVVCISPHQSRPHLASHSRKRRTVWRKTLK